MPEPADEHRHRPGDDPRWEESWHLDFAAEDGTFGGYVRLALVPGAGRSRVWACVVGEGRRLVTVVEPDAPLPRAGALDLRCDGLWTDLVCETPLEHWTVGLEAFGVALDDPGDVHLGLRGERLGLGFDLEWETVGPATGDGGHGDEGYALPCEVHGEVLVGTEVIDFAGWGTRSHRWGAGGRWSRAWSSAAGRLDDGTRWHTPEHAASVPPDATGVAAGTTVAPGIEVTGPGHDAPVPVVGPDGRAGRLARTLCRTSGPDGRSGTAWASAHRPSSSD